jgi:hypothetical protein
MQTPTLADLKSYLGLEASDTADDVALQESLDAALAAQRRVCALPCDEFGDAYYSDDMVLAVLLRSQRYVARRNSPEGVVGLSGAGGDFAAARVPSFDADVLHLESPYRKLPVA